jgi:hypothetical protein
MFDDLGPWLDRGKAKDLLNRLENEKPNQALPAEYELSISWAVSKIATLEIDRPSGTRTPDIYSPDLLPSGPVIADVAALDDFSLSGADSMRRACNIINAEADRFLANSSSHLHYTFDETMGYERARNGGSAFSRRRLVRRDFEMDQELRDKLKTWIDDRPQGQTFALKNEEISVMVEWRGYVHPLSNYFCKMPSLTYNLKENPLYASLRLKSKQLRAAEVGVRRIIFLGDAGCGLLRDLSPLHDDFVRDTPHIDVDTTVKEYTKLMDRLSSFGHDIEKSFGLPPEEAEREAMDALDTFDRLATLIMERHDSLLSEAADAAQEALADELFGQVQSELDVLSTHSSVEGVHLEGLSITSLDSNRIVFEGDGSVYVRLQYGLDADVRRDDGAVSYDSYPLNCKFEADTERPPVIAITSGSLHLDTNSFYNDGEES